MNNQHTFEMSRYPIREWLDPSVTIAGIQQFWQIKEYVNGEFRQLWRPFDSETAAARAVKCLDAYFNRSLLAWSHGSNWRPSTRSPRGCSQIGAAETNNNNAEKRRNEEKNETKPRRQSC